MKIFGIEINRVKNQAMSLVPSNVGWLGLVRESFGGAFQAHVTIDNPRNILANSAVFSCATGIASDISKLCIELVEEDENHICTEVVSTSPYWAVLKKPNHYQNRIKFVEQWIVSKLLHGNTYVLKERDQRGIVIRLYILNPQRVKPLVTEDGSVYYELSADNLSGLDKTVTVPASEIIHDMMISLWHPLVGISPIYACALSATMGNKIQGNSTKFFDNMSRPSGMLMAPGTISDDDANRLKNLWEQNFTGSNLGRLAVLGSGMKYEAMTIPANEAQLIEQLKWTVEDVARCFHYPLFKLGGTIPQGISIESMQQMYYTDCLQTLIESLELCLDEGLDLYKNSPPYYTNVNLKGLLRMDAAAQIKFLSDAVKAAIMSPNEARAEQNLNPVAGGASPYLQQQNFSLQALAKRDALPNPFVIDKPTSNPTPSSTGSAGTADPANDDAYQAAARLADSFIAGLMIDHVAA